MSIFNFFKKDKPISETIQAKAQEFPKIKKFDRDEYVNDTFNTIFVAIQNDDEWKRDVSDSVIKFTKVQHERWENRFTGVTIVVSIHFQYKFKSNVFTIENIKLNNETNYDPDFYYKGTLPDDIKSFLYGMYSQWVNELNIKEKASVDRSLSHIRAVVGKSAERQSKIDNLFN